MRNVASFVRGCFVLGAVTDGLAILPMLSPRIGSTLFGGELSRLSTEYRFAMSLGASLMAGWTVLLIWGALRPIERRDVLLITLFPVVTGLVCGMMYGIQHHVVALSHTLPLFAHLSVVSGLYIYAYVRAGAALPPKHRPV